MEYSLLDHGDKKRIVFYGNIKPSSREKFLEIIAQMPGEEKKEWILDVHEFEYIDSAGLGMLIELYEMGRREGISLTIEGARAAVRRMFDLSKFELMFTIVD